MIGILGRIASIKKKKKRERECLTAKWIFLQGPREVRERERERAMKVSGTHLVEESPLKWEE